MFQGKDVRSLHFPPWRRCFTAPCGIDYKPIPLSRFMPKAPFEIAYTPISFASYQRYSPWLHINDVRIFPADKTT